LGEELKRERERREAAEVKLESTWQQVFEVLKPQQQRSIANISFEELHNVTDGFEASKIGRGGFGSVFPTHRLPSLPHSGRCAVKKLLGAGGMQGLTDEIRVLSVCWHEHLLPLVGFCLDEPMPCLVYPLMVGSLESRVVNPPRGQQRFGWQERVLAIRDATRALVYLHMPLETRSPVLHRDIKPSNILLDAQGNAKLADVGVGKNARELQSGVHSSTHRVIGTPGFIDPLYTRVRTHTYMRSCMVHYSALSPLRCSCGGSNQDRRLACRSRENSVSSPMGMPWAFRCLCVWQGVPQMTSIALSMARHALNRSRTLLRSGLPTLLSKR